MHTTDAAHLKASSARPLVPAGFLALGTFAIGTEGFMIAPLLPTMAADFDLRLSAVALLVVVFTLTLPLSSPVLTVVTARMNRRGVLLLAMGIFATGNLVAAWSSSFGVLMAARVLMAVAAGLYVPNANALAGVIVPERMRGRALAIVSGGVTLAIALGLPLGGLVGHAFGWRATFLAVGAMSLVAAAGILAGIARDAGDGLPVAGVRARLAVFWQARILLLLSVTLFWSIGAYAAYPYVAPYLIEVLGFGPTGITATVSLWGIAAAAGVMTGGVLNDRFGSGRVVVWSLAALGLSFLTLSLVARAGPTLLPGRVVLGLVMVAIVVWGFSVWSFFPAQMSRLIAAGPASQAALALALNTSTMYLGFAVGSALGDAAIEMGAVWAIGILAAVAEAVALLLDAGPRRKGCPCPAGQGRCRDGRS